MAVGFSETDVGDRNTRAVVQSQGRCGRSGCRAVSGVALLIRREDAQQTVKVSVAACKSEGFSIGWLLQHFLFPKRPCFVVIMWGVGEGECVIGCLG